MEKNDDSGRWGGEFADRLEQKTIETMTVDEPYVVVPARFSGLEDVVWIDEVDGVKALAIERSESVKLLEAEDYESGDDVMIIMRTWNVNESGEIIEGLVADVRGVRATFDRFDSRNEIDKADDTEELWNAIKVDREKMRIVAIVDSDEAGDVYYGDPAFKLAAEHLRQQNDKIIETFELGLAEGISEDSSTGPEIRDRMEKESKKEVKDEAGNDK